jgi:hypothetical protein
MLSLSPGKIKFKDYLRDLNRLGRIIMEKLV